MMHTPRCLRLLVHGPFPWLHAFASLHGSQVKYRLHEDLRAVPAIINDERICVHAVCPCCGEQWLL